jgi:hypothetical protein
MEICNQLLQGIDGQGRSSGLVDRVVQLEEEKPSPISPVSLDRSTSKSDRHQDFIQIPRIGCVFTQQDWSAFDMLLIRPSVPQRQPGSGYGSFLFNSA